ncbi:MAG: MFS transporter [Desulfonatronovibrionaceae bacterium]
MTDTIDAPGKDIHQTISRKHKWMTLTAVGLSILMGTIDMSIVNVSLPILVDELDTNFSTVQWVILGYVLVNTSLMLGVARLGDLYNKKTLYVAGLAIFTIGSFLCGLSWNIYWLIAFRVLQGLGGVFLQALGMALVVEVFPLYERGRALGLIGGVVSVGLSSGPALGGIIIGTLGWNWIFWINIPIGALAIYTLLRYVPSSGGRKEKQGFDLIGTLVMMIVLSCYALAMTRGQDSGFNQPLIQILLLTSGVGAVFFLLLEKRLKRPMVDLALFRNILFGLGILMGFMTFILLGGTMFLLPFFLKYVQGYPTQIVGLLLMVVPIGEGVISPVAGWLADRWGPLGIRLIGSITIMFGCFLVSTIHAETTMLGYIARIFPLGMGIGTFQATNNTAVMGSVPGKRLGISSGLLALSRNLGVTTGIPLVGTLFTALILSTTGTASMDISSVSASAISYGFSRTYLWMGFFMLLPVILGGISLWYAKTHPAAEVEDLSP